MKIQNIRCAISGSLRILEFFIFSDQIDEIPETCINIGEFWTGIGQNKHNFVDKTLTSNAKRLSKFSIIFECGTVQTCVNREDLFKIFQTR